MQWLSFSWLELRFDFLDGREQALFLLGAEIGHFALRIDVEKVDNAWRQEQQVDHTCSAAFSFSAGEPAHFPQATPSRESRRPSADLPRGTAGRPRIRHPSTIPAASRKNLATQRR